MWGFSHPVIAIFSKTLSHQWRPWLFWLFYVHVNKPFQSLILSQVISCFLQADVARKANLHALRTSFHKRGLELQILWQQMLHFLSCRTYWILTKQTTHYFNLRWCTCPKKKKFGLSTCKNVKFCTVSFCKWTNNFC